MPLTNGKLLVHQEQKIKKNYRMLKTDVDAKDLTDFFIEREIFDFPDVDKINNYNPNTQENRNNCFFQLLFQSGPRAYDVFLYALRQNKLDHIVDILERTEVTASTAEDSASFMTSIPESVRLARLSERDLSRLAQSLGVDWEMVPLQMGLTQAQIEQCKMENPYSVPMQVYACLNKWRLRESRNATLDQFVRTLIDCQSTTVDWALIHNVAQQMSS